MKKLYVLCIILCLSQPMHLLAMVKTAKRQTAPVVHVVKILDENGRAICEPRNLIQPSPLHNNIGSFDLSVVRVTGVYTCESFVYTDESAPFTYSLLLPDRGSFTFWLDDRAFWCSNEVPLVVDAKDYKGRTLVNKNGEPTKRVMPLSRTLPH